MVLDRVLPSGSASPWRWVVLSGAVLFCILLLALGGWAWWSSFQSRGSAEFERAMLRVRAGLGPQVSPEARAEATRELQALIDRHPRLPFLPQAAYQLGNLHYQARSFDEARKAYELCLATGARDTLATLCRLGIGYAWEAHGNRANALKAYEAARQGLTPQDFLYEEISLNLARSYELSGQPNRARETYSRLLKDLPEGPSREEVRARLARLEAPPLRP